MPCRPRITIQENVRTTTLVRIGKITMKTSTACQRADARAQIHAIGYPNSRHTSVALTPSSSVAQRMLRLKLSVKNLAY